jgi:putative hydrolase
MTPRRLDAGTRRARRPAARSGPSLEPTGRAPAIDDDVNAAIAGLLLDLAALQEGPRALAYKRAAHAVLGLAQPASALRNGPKLAKIPYVGPSSERVILEYLDSGHSPTVERAIHESGQADAVAARRSLRVDFISQATAETVLEAPAHGLVTLADYRGDFQMHSTWSDGGQTLERIVEAAIALGQTCAGVTDHGYGLPIASGMSMEAVSRQHAAIDELNERREGEFRLFKGIEANIRADGRIDMEPDELRRFEFVVASPHSALRSRADQTARMVAAVSHPFVDILGHPRGRRYDVRPGVSADWSEVFAAAAERRVAIEIDGYPDRQDIDWTLAAAALEAGCLLALDSDAHATEELLFSRMAIAHARLAGVPRERVINCWSDEELEAWMNRGEREAGRSAGR